MKQAIADLLVPFEQELYEAALHNLKDASNKLRLNNFGYAMRELYTKVLHRLAPDEDVKQCTWYKNEAAPSDKPTRRERAVYAVQGGLSEDYVSEELAIDAADVYSQLLQAVTKLNGLTHISDKAFSAPPDDVEGRAEEVETALADFCSTIRLCRLQIVEALNDKIDDSVVAEVLRETIMSLDELATHHGVDEVYLDNVAVTTIGPEMIRFMAKGSLGVVLQWGSNSDVKNDIGATMNESFPFSCELSSPVSDPAEVECDEDSLKVDTSSWYDMRDENDRAQSLSSDEPSEDLSVPTEKDDAPF